MKVIIPNAKELNTKMDSFPPREICGAGLSVLSVMSEMSVDQLAHFYKLNESKSQLEYDRWKRIANKEAKNYPAWELYDGLMYRYMDRRELSQAEIDFLTKHVRIATGLYGLIQPFKLIAPHRLDFQGGVKVEGQSLKQYWRSIYDQEVAEEEWVLSLASSEFEQVFSPKMREKFIQLTFMEKTEKGVRTHSTISKKGRGRMLSWLAKHQVKDSQQLQAFDGDGFRYCPERSTEKNLVFIRDKV